MALIDRAALKAWLNIESGDASRDAELDAALAAAEAAVLRLVNRAYGVGTGAETMIGNGGLLMFPKRAPITAIESMTIDGVAVAALNRHDAVARADGARFPNGAVVVLTLTGGAPAPDDVVLAAKITAAAMFNAPAFDGNLAAESSASFSGSFQPGGPGSIPVAAQSLLAPHRRMFGW